MPIPRGLSHLNELVCFPMALARILPFGGPYLAVRDGRDSSRSSKEDGKGGIKVQITMDPNISATPAMTHMRGDMALAGRLPDLASGFPSVATGPQARFRTKPQRDLLS